jgi:GT2 family glycosyltransferase
VAARELLSFDLVVATVDRVDPLEVFLDSLERQTHRRFRVLIVDQNEDDRLVPVIAGSPSLEIVRLRSSRGLARARNSALGRLTADLVAFPDDDCVYPPDLLERVALRLADTSLDGLTGRAVGLDGRSSESWRLDPAILTDDNLWNRAISYTIFLRRRVVETVGAFDEQLGLGSGTAWSSGEETDYLVRAVRSGARIAFDPTLTVVHDETPLSRHDLRTRGFRDGASVGYILRKHHYPARVLTRMLIRPLGGAVVSLARGDMARARFHLATLRGRIVGLGQRAK